MYEIFDVDAEDCLERGHLIAMWRMLNDYDAYEEESIALYGLKWAATTTGDERHEGSSSSSSISKARFCEVSAGNALLIQPAIDFQSKLRRVIGGRSSWVSMTNHRYRSFRMIIARSPNLNAFLESMIVEAREYGLRRSEPDADSKLMASHAKLQIDNELAGELSRLSVLAGHHHHMYTVAVLCKASSSSSSQSHFTSPRRHHHHYRSRTAAVESADAARADALGCRGS